MSRRVYEIAKDLHVTSKAIVAKCTAEGITGISNHMSVVPLELEATIRVWFSSDTDPADAYYTDPTRHHARTQPPPSPEKQPSSRGEMRDSKNEVRAMRSRAVLPPAASPSLPKQSDQSRHSHFHTRQRKALAELIDSCLTRRVPAEVNLSIPRHGITGPVLREVAYRADYRGQVLPIVFTDSSHPPPFPAGILASDLKVPEETKEGLLARQHTVLKVGTMSMRHPELDYLIDLYICRNMELAREDSTSADVEHLAFDRTFKFLLDPAIESVPEIWVYHTGFEPMNVGFYRGLARGLEERRTKGKAPLMIRPWLYEPSGQQPQHEDNNDAVRRRYSPESLGANAASYTPCTPWF